MDPQQKISDQPVNRAQPPAPVTERVQQVQSPPPSPPQPAPSQMISTPKESEAAIVSSDNAIEESSQSGGEGVTQGEALEVQPAVPEFTSGSAEVEAIVERAPDQEKPEIPQEVQDAGVTHSGPGVIVTPKVEVKETSELPVPYQQAVEEEKKTKFHESKHWFMALVIYLWKRINVNEGKEKATNREEKKELVK